MERTVTVAATGTVDVEPDIATISTGVTSEAATAREALAKNTDAMKKVVDGLKARGIEARDIQTTQFQIDPTYQTAKDGSPPRIVGYRVNNSVSLVVRDIAKLGEIIDAVVTLGANRAGQIGFEASKAETLRDEARKQAIANALRRAKLYAEAAGASVGQVLTITEGAGGGMHPMPMGRVAMSKAAPIERGTEHLEVSVEVTWALQ
jgi:uncharacterized protein YggE